MPSWDITTWIAVGASALAALLLGITVGLAARLRRRNEPVAPPPERDERAWEEVRRERAASARARSELHWLRRLAEVGAADSLEASLRRILESAAGLAEASAAMLVLHQPDRDPLAATFGLSAAESSRELLGLPPGGSEARAVSLSYRYSPEEAAHDEFRLTGGVALPVLGEGGARLGTLAVFWRRIERELTDAELERLEGLVAALGPSLRNVFRFEELRRAVDRDAVTGLPGRRSLQDMLEVECARARRYTHPLSLLLLRASGEERLRTAAGRLPADVRAPDLVHHLGDGRFVVVLPESTLVDAERLARRLRLALGEGPTPAAYVELRFEDDAVSLLERGEAAVAAAEVLATGRSWSSAVEPRAGHG